MEEIKAPKKERKFLKGLGEIALVLIRELVLGIGKKVINKVGNKREKLVIAIIILASSITFAQYPATGNKQRLGYQSTGDGLVFRGRSNDTTALKPSTINNAYHLFDTVNNVLFSYIKTKGGWKFNNSDTVIINGVTMPFDSITFNTAKDGTVGVGEVEYNDTQGSLIQGLKGGLVTNVIGQQLHQRVNNRTGSTLAKGDVVYLSGSQGNRITVAKAIATSDPTSANTFGIVAESIADNQSGYVITEGLLTNINTSALTVDSAVYLSGTTAGALTSNKPQAPIHGVYIGVCVKSNAGSGEVFVKIRNGQELDELHDVQITNPTSNASLFYKSSEGLWRDTTAALLVSDTASMLTNYLRSGVAASTYLTQSLAASTYLPLTGGTLTGALNGTIGTFTGLNIVNTTTEGVLTLQGYDNNTASVIQFRTGGTVRQEIRKPSSSANLQFRSYPTGTGTGGYEFYVSNGSSETLAATIGTDKSLSLTGTLGVTGATTLSNLAGSGTRMVTASTTGLLSTQTILTPTTRGSNTFTLPDIGSITFLRYNADNTVSQRAADGMRSDLGGTTIGQSMFTLTNPSAITFPRFNADNTVTALDAATFRTAIGAGTGNGNGTVTSVTGTLPISSSGGTTPNITIANAGVSTTGVVTASTQTFGGDKTFNGVLNASSDLNVTGLSTLTGGATIGTMSTQSALTNILGVNSSNTIGEIGLNSVFSLSSGVLNIQDAGASQRGIVTATTQSFGGNKTFTDIVGFSKAIQRPISTITGNTTIQTSNCWIIVNNTGGTTTLTLPDATLATGTELMIKTAQAQAVISASSNVVPLTFANTASTNILPATDGAWCTLVSNGTFWVTMQANF